MADDRAKFVHDMEQFGAMAAQFADIVGQYHKALLAKGFMRDEALRLTMAWQTTTWEGIVRKGMGPRDG